MTRPLRDRCQGYTENYLAKLGANPAEPQNDFDEDLDFLARGGASSQRAAALRTRTPLGTEGSWTATNFYAD